MKNSEYKVLEKIELFTFLKSNVKGSKNNIKSLLTKKHVFVNGKNQTQYNYILNKGDIVSIKTTTIETKNNIKLNIIYEDEDIIVINKPSGILSIANEKEKEFTIYHMVMEYLKSINKNNKVFIIHRLDKDTSGILIFAKNEKIKKLFQDNWNDIVKERKYYAVVHGIPNVKKDVIKSYLKEEKNYIVHKANNESEGKLAITEYKIIKTNNKYSLLDVNIKTGRKNQIRVHLKDIGNPIVGDKKYGIRGDKSKRLLLHAYKLEILDPRNNKKIIFETKIPLELKKSVN